jgi:AcrR family transcriptional regulator
MSTNGQIQQIVQICGVDMDQEKKDRRRRKTRQQLRSALLSLLKEKRYEEISVQDIIEQADVARSTFYIHYVDKDDLLTGGQGIFAQNLGQQLMAHTRERGATVFSSRAWFAHVRVQEPILKLIARDSAMDLAMKTLREIIHRSVEEGMQAHAQVGQTSVPMSVPMSALVDYLTDTLMTLIKWWFRDGMRYTPEQMDEMFQRLVMPGISSVLHRAA